MALARVSGTVRARQWCQCSMISPSLRSRVWSDDGIESTVDRCRQLDTVQRNLGSRAEHFISSIQQPAQQPSKSDTRAKRPARVLTISPPLHKSQSQSQDSHAPTTARRSAPPTFSIQYSPHRLHSDALIVMLTLVNTTTGSCSVLHLAPARLASRLALGLHDPRFSGRRASDC